MRTQLQVLIGLLFLVPFMTKANPLKTNPKEWLSKNKIQASFEENLGQVLDQNRQPRRDVLFSGQSAEMVYHVRNTGISYNLSKVTVEENFGNNTFTNHLNIENSKIYNRENYRVDVNWIGSSQDIDVIKGSLLDGYTNYYNVAEGSAPALCVKNYQSILFRNLWEGVDLHYYSTNGVLESDWLMRKAEDFKKIRFEVKGAELSVSEDGYLLLKTPFGEIREGKLKVFQNNELLNAKWVINNNVVSFEIENYNPTLALRIDPPTLAFATYYGGSGEDRGLSVLVDSVGNIFMGGESSSTLNIATTGSHQTNYGGGNLDGFLVKFNSNGVRQWATYFGGSGHEFIYNTSIDGMGNIYATGATSSSSNFATVGAHQSTYSGGEDAYLTKFDDLGQLLWTTYYGGSGLDWGLEVLAHKNNVYICGSTSSSNNISSSGSFQSTSGGSGDGFIAKFDMNGIRLWGTFVGGMGSDAVIGIAMDENDNLYASGQTTSSASIATNGTHSSTKNGGGWNSFLQKYDTSGVRLWGSYFGTSAIVTKCATYKDNIYFTGYTSGLTGIASNGHQDSFGGDHDAFLVNFNPNGGLKWSTYYGGSGLDIGQSCATDSNGNVYITGYTLSTNNISTLDAHQAIKGNGEDAFFAAFDSTGNRILGSYLGGDGDDRAMYMVLDKFGDFYISGFTSSSNNISSLGSHQSTNAGGKDAFLAKFANGCTMPTITLNPSNKTVTINSNTNFVVIASGNNILYQWQVNKGNGFENLVDSGQFRGVNSDTLWVTNLTMANDSFIFRCIVSSGICDTISNNAILTIDNSTFLNQISNYLGVKVYPNPTGNVMVLETPTELIGKSFSIHDLHGKILQTTIITKEQLEVDLSNFTHGLYLLQIHETNIAIRFLKY
jgi:hypothetical protein